MTWQIWLVVVWFAIGFPACLMGWLWGMAHEWDDIDV